MLALIKLFFEITLFKKAPQDIPDSKVLFQLVIAVYMIISFSTMWLNTSILNALIQVGVELFLALGFCQIILMLAAKQERFQQTLMALLGVDAIISLFAFPVLISLSSFGFNFILIIALAIWHWIVTAHILRHALTQAFSFCLGIALLYILGSYWVMGWVFAMMRQV